MPSFNYFSGHFIKYSKYYTYYIYIGKCEISLTQISVFLPDYYFYIFPEA